MQRARWMVARSRYLKAMAGLVSQWSAGSLVTGAFVALHRAREPVWFPTVVSRPGERVVIRAHAPSGQGSRTRGVRSRLCED